ncbi:hypothetical protein LINPERHAP2_LOCUS33000 [Linum perenne]
MSELVLRLNSPGQVYD